MKHQKYESIDGVWQQKTLIYYKQMGLDIGMWCVTEKAHGSNFAFYVSATEMKFAKRSSFIYGEEKFFQFDRMLKDTAHRCQAIFDNVAEHEKELDYIIVYGELIGGHYPHKDVSNLNNVRQIQKGVWYNPDIKFYAYDIKVILKDKSSYFIYYPIACHYFEITGLTHAHIIFAGTFEQCVEYSNKFQTTIPDKFGLPPIEDNICEGIVIKPFQSAFTPDGERVILKSKNEKFYEVATEHAPKATRKQKQVLSRLGELVLSKIKDYITENRIRNVLSKFGEFTKKDFGEIHEMIYEDILKDFNKDYDDLYWKMEQEDINMMKKVLGRMITLEWRPIFLSEAI